MKRLIEKSLIKIAKLIDIDLLAHAHVQLGVGHNTYFSGEEHFVKNELSNILKAHPKVIFDVGANIGTYAKNLRRHYPNSEIYCFEPLKKTFDQLKQNTEACNLVYNNFGLSSTKQALNVFIGSENHDASMATLYPETIESIFTFAGKISAPIKCEFETLDDYCTENSIEMIDFLKIDVEGHELDVLKGGIDLLKRNAIRVVQFEFNEFNLSSKSFIKDFYDILPQYSFFRIHPQNKLKAMGAYNSNHEIFRYQNIVAVNNNVV